MRKISWTPFEKFESSEKLLAKLNPTLSKSKLKRMMKKYGFPQKSWEAQKSVYLPLGLLNDGRISPTYTGPEMKILFENNNFLALEKASLIHSHPLCYEDSKNCLSFLVTKNKLAPVFTNKTGYDRGLLHRLDYETSGVLVFAKKDKVYGEVRGNFSEIAKKKKYLALVRGDAQSLVGVHRHFLKPSGLRGSRMVRDLSGFEAFLEVLKVSYNREKNVSCLEISLKTGLRHQIRFQLSELGFPILGDKLYGGEKAKRLFLHAYYYEFLYRGEKIYIESKKPQGF